MQAAGTQGLSHTGVARESQRRHARAGGVPAAWGTDEGHRGALPKGPSLAQSYGGDLAKSSSSAPCWLRPRWDFSSSSRESAETEEGSVSPGKVPFPSEMWTQESKSFAPAVLSDVLEREAAPG